MVNRIIRKLKCKNGGVPVVLAYTTLSLVMILFIIFSRSNRHYSWSIKTFSIGLKTSSKAALLQYKFEDSNFQLISQGYVEGEQDYNHFIEINHTLANETFYKMLDISTKKLYGEATLKQYTKIAIIEPKRIGVNGEYNSNAWTYTMTIYKGTSQIYREENIAKSQIDSIIGKINTQTTSLDIKNTGNLINSLNPRTYYVGIIEELPLKGVSSINLSGAEPKMMNMYYFEGVNAVRTMNMREGN